MNLLMYPSEFMSYCASFPLMACCRLGDKIQTLSYCRVLWDLAPLSSPTCLPLQRYCDCIYLPWILFRSGMTSMTLSLIFSSQCQCPSLEKPVHVSNFKLPFLSHFIFFPISSFLKLQYSICDST